jgi:hypothetical protein
MSCMWARSLARSQGRELGFSSRAATEQMRAKQQAADRARARRARAGSGQGPAVRVSARTGWRGELHFR